MDPHSGQDDVVEADHILAAFQGEATSGVAASLVTGAREGSLDLQLLDAMLELPVHEQAFLIAVWLGLEHFTDDLEKRYLAWLADARRPECGWLTVAERLFVVKAQEAGIATLKRAVSASDKTPQDQYERVLEHAVSYVTQHGTAADMRWWLELTAPD
ncbi:MAG: hypothetical protein R3E66_10390 [bacterium]